MDENALETLSVNFELRGYAEAIKGVRDFNKAVDTIPPKVKKVVSTLIGLDETVSKVGERFSTGADRIRQSFSRVSGVIGKITSALAGLKTTSIGFDVSPIDNAIGKVKLLAGEIAKTKNLVNNIPTITPLARPPLPVIAPLANPAPARGAAGQSPLEVKTILPVFVRAFHGTALSQLKQLVGRAAGGGGGSQQSSASSRGSAMGLAEGALKKIAVTSAAVTTGIIGLTRSGLQGSVQGFRLSFAFEQLTKQIASILLPVIDRLTTGLQNLVFRLQRLDGDGQRRLLGGAGAIAGAGLAAGGILAVVKGVGALLPMLNLLAPALGGAAAAGGPLAAILVVVGAAVAALTAGFIYLAATSKPVQEALQKVGAALQKVLDDTKPIREILFQIAEKLAVLLLDRLVKDLGNLANVIQFATSAIPAFILGMEEVGKLLMNMPGDILRDFKAGFNKAEAGGIVERLFAPILGVQNVGAGAQNRVNDIAEKVVAEQQRVFNKLFGQVKPAVAGKPRQDLVPLNPGREDADAAFQRIQEAILKRGGQKGPEERAAEAAEAQVALLGQLLGVVIPLAAAGQAVVLANRPIQGGAPR